LYRVREAHHPFVKLTFSMTVLYPVDEYL